MTSQMLALADFLLARIAEDEALDGVWGEMEVSGEDRAVGAAEYADVDRCRDNYERRIKAECEAKRQIVERIRADVVHTDHQPDSCDLSWFADDLLGLLALPYADHADYRDEWRP